MLDKDKEKLKNIANHKHLKILKNMSYTDDTMLTLGVAKWLMEDKQHSKDTLIDIIKDFGSRDKQPTFSKEFKKWVKSDSREPYASGEDGCAMRVSPIGCYAQTIEDVLGLAETSALCTHNTQDGIEGAKFVAAAIFWIRKGCSKEQVKENLAAMTSYNIDLKYDEIKDDYGWKYGATCKGTVPYAFIAFYESNSFEDAIRRAVSLGGDSDTIAAICGGMAAAYYGIPQKYVDFVCKKLPKEFLDVINQFDGKALEYLKKDKL